MLPRAVLSRVPRGLLNRAPSYSASSRSTINSRMSSSLVTHTQARLPVTTSQDVHPLTHYTCAQHVRMVHTCTVAYAKKAKKGGKEKKEKGGKKGSSSPKVHLTTGEVNEVIQYDKMIQQMEGVIHGLKQEYHDHLSLRTNIGVFDNLQVDTPDGKFMLIQLGQIVQKNPNLVIINMVSSPQYIGNVKTALSESGLNINPQQEGTTLFVPLPKVTREHRESLAKNAKTLSDKTRDKLRDVHNKFVRDIKKKKEVSEDLIHNIQEMIKSDFQQHSSQIDDLLAAKQKELLQK